MLSLKKILLILSLFSHNLLANTQVVMDTNLGKLEIELFDKLAPVTVKNFLSYIKSGHYSNTIFHRVINDFMIQGGGYDANLKLKKTNKPIINEATNGLKNTYGTLAMARTNAANSATTQFFINVKENSFLNHKNKSDAGFGYAVFGKVKKISLSVVAKIKAASVKRNGLFGNLPVNNIIIKSAKIVAVKK